MRYFWGRLNRTLWKKQDKTRNKQNPPGLDAQPPGCERVKMMKVSSWVYSAAGQGDQHIWWWFAFKVEGESSLISEYWVEVSGVQDKIWCEVLAKTAGATSGSQWIGESWGQDTKDSKLGHDSQIGRRGGGVVGSRRLAWSLSPLNLQPCKVGGLPPRTKP